MKLQEFLSKYLGQSKGYPEGKYVGECLSIVKLYIKECFGIDPPPSGTNSAYGYWSNFPSPLNTKFEKVENTTELVPEEGWIVIWKPWTGNIYGHIAICGDGSTKYILDNYAQNWSSKNFKEEVTDYDNVIGYLKPLQIETNMTEEQKRILDFIRTRTEGEVRQAFGALQDLPNLNKEMESLKSSYDSMEERLAQLEADAKANNELIIGWQSEVSGAKSMISKLQADLKIQADEKNVWKNRYENALTQFPSKYDWKDIINLIINKLKK